MTRTVADKLLITPGKTVWSSDPARTGRLMTLPDGVVAAARPDGADVAVVLADDRATLDRVLAEHGGALASVTTTWVAYPKGNRSDLNRDSLWPLLTPHGLRPNGQVAVDDTWSALRFRASREGEPPFRGGKG